MGQGYDGTDESGPGVGQPAGYGVAITASDTDDLPHLTRAIYVGGAGNMVVVWEDGTTTTFTGVTAGSVYPVRARRVNSTDTTASELVALW